MKEPEKRESVCGAMNRKSMSQWGSMANGPEEAGVGQPAISA